MEQNEPVKEYEFECNDMKTDSEFDNNKFITIKEAINQNEGNVQLRGWVYRVRNSNKFVFIVIRDHTEIIQCIVKKENNPELFDEASKLSMESSIKLSGSIKKDERAPSGYEVTVEKLETVQLAMPFPITKDFSPEYLLDNRHLWLRSRKMTAIFKIRHTVTGAIHEFFRNRGYYQFDAPIFQPNACEGGSTLFEVKYFKDIVYLAQSWQLYAEAGIFALGKIYNMSPTFRSEKSKTSRHLAEFWMAEMEVAWMKLEECVQVGKDELKFIMKKVLENNKQELEILGRDIEKLKPSVEKDYPTITYTEALKLLKEKKGMDVKWGKDLRTVEEEKLMELFDTPVAIVDYPKEVMAFYKQEKKLRPGVDKDDAPGPVALCFDMLAPEGYGEIIGGSQRDTDMNELQKYLKREGEDPKNYDWYLDLRKYGSVPHSGYGVGVERVVRWICGLENIKDAIPFPRTMLRKTP
jgi:asparaginyl-tRNA synthetase